MHVALYGASAKPDRYAYMAFTLLREYGQRVFPVHPVLESLDGEAVYRDLASIEEPIDTITLYIGPARQKDVEADILGASCRRVIFNPGTENPELQKKLAEKGIEVVESCTLVMLKSGLFDS